jgi:hypothetical protein
MQDFNITKQSKAFKPYTAYRRAGRKKLERQKEYYPTFFHFVRLIQKIFRIIFHPARFPLFLSGNIFNIPL